MDHHEQHHQHHQKEREEKKKEQKEYERQQEKNLLPTPGGQASFAVLLFQDLAVIPLLLVLGMLTPEHAQSSFDWTSLAKALGMIVALIVGGRLLLRPVLRYVANTRTTWRPWRSDFSANRPCGKRPDDTGPFTRKG